MFINNEYYCNLPMTINMIQQLIIGHRLIWWRLFFRKQLYFSKKDLYLYSRYISSL